MQRLEKIVPLSCIAASFLVLSPLDLMRLSYPALSKIHFLSYAVLGICFEIPELSLNALCLFLARDQESFRKKKPLIADIFKVRYVLTHFVAPASGILAVASGVYLTHRGGYSLTEGWPFWILFAATIGLYKGMYQHNTYIKKIRRLIHAHGPREADVRQALLSPFDHLLIFLEFPTYVFIYWTAATKPIWLNPFSSPIGGLEHMGSTWTAGLAVVVLGAFWLIPLRLGMRRFSPKINDRAVSI